MDKNDQYRREAERAQKAADNATNDHDRSAWLRIAQGWLGLLEGRGRSQAQQSFDAEVKSRGTGQKDSDESH